MSYSGYDIEDAIVLNRWVAKIFWSWISCAVYCGAIPFYVERDNRREKVESILLFKSIYVFIRFSWFKSSFTYSSRYFVIQLIIWLLNYLFLPLFISLFISLFIYSFIHLFFIYTNLLHFIRFFMMIDNLTYWWRRYRMEIDQLRFISNRITSICHSIIRLFEINAVLNQISTL